MIAPDANLLIYAYDKDSPFNRRAARWLDSLLSSGEPIGIPLFTVHGFLRFVTNSRLHKRPATFREASSIVESWLALPAVRILYPGERHWGLFQELCTGARVRGADLTDAAIAATAIEYGAIVHTNDRDFARFPGLRWHNPLE